MRRLIVIVCIIPFLSCSKSVEDIGKTLSHSPTDEISITISNAEIKVDFNLDENMRDVIASEAGQNKIDNIKTREELIEYYRTLLPCFQPGYSSMSDDNHYVFAKVEYLLAQECFQNDCSSLARRNVLENAVDKQKNKFETQYIAPSFTRRTGTFLIAVILLKEEDDSFIQALINNVDFQKVLLCLNHNTWMDAEEVNNKLIQYAENFLAKK